MRVLITGASGFVGSHLAELCAREGDEVIGLSRDAAPGGVAWAPIQADLCDREAATAAVRDARPDRVFHLAAEASVRQSWTDPQATLAGNVTSTLNLLEAVV